MFARLRKLQFFKAVESCTGGYGRFRCQRVKILERGRLEERLGRRGPELKETREALLLSHASGFITDVEFLLLYKENMSDNLDFPYDEYPSFNLQDKNEAEYKANFRVEKHLVSRPVDALNIPAVFKCQQGTVCEKE